MKITVTDPELIREIAADPSIGRFRITAKAAGHQFKPNDIAVLTGLTDFTEYNGQQVKITDIREDGPCGRAYYIEGEINTHLDWTYEYRLAKV